MGLPAPHHEDSGSRIEAMEPRLAAALDPPLAQTDGVRSCVGWTPSRRGGPRHLSPHRADRQWLRRRHPGRSICDASDDSLDTCGPPCPEKQAAKAVSWVFVTAGLPPDADDARGPLPRFRRTMRIRGDRMQAADMAKRLLDSLRKEAGFTATQVRNLNSPPVCRSSATALWRLRDKGVEGVDVNARDGVIARPWDPHVRTDHPTSAAGDPPADGSRLGPRPSGARARLAAAPQTPAIVPDAPRTAATRPAHRTGTRPPGPRVPTHRRRSRRPTMGTRPGAPPPQPSAGGTGDGIDVDAAPPPPPRSGG